MKSVQQIRKLRKGENAVPGNKEFNLETPAEKTKNMAKVHEQNARHNDNIEPANKILKCENIQVFVDGTNARTVQATKIRWAGSASCVKESNIHTG